MISVAIRLSILCRYVYVVSDIYHFTDDNLLDRMLKPRPQICSNVSTILRTHLLIVARGVTPGILLNDFQIC